MSLLDDLTTLETELLTVADAGRAIEMAAYLKNQFDVLGVATPERRAALKLSLIHI